MYTSYSICLFFLRILSLPFQFLFSPSFSLRLSPLGSYSSSGFPSFLALIFFFSFSIFLLVVLCVSSPCPSSLSCFSSLVYLYYSSSPCLSLCPFSCFPSLTLFLFLRFFLFLLQFFNFLFFLFTSLFSSPVSSSSCYAFYPFIFFSSSFVVLSLAKPPPSHATLSSDS